MNELGRLRRLARTILTCAPLDCRKEATCTELAKSALNLPDPEANEAAEEEEWAARSRDRRMGGWEAS